MKMRTLFISVLLGAALVFGTLVVGAQGPKPQGAHAALGPAFTYHGQLRKNGVPVNDSCKMGFSLYDAALGGTQVGGTQVVASVGVTNGLFVVLVNAGGEFGATAFNGQERWLQVAVQCTGDGGPVPLTRELLTAVPYAQYSLNTWAVSGNAGMTANNVLGTTDNMRLTLAVSNTAALRLVPASHPYYGFAPNLIGGYSGNTVDDGVVGATIGGGGASSAIDHVSGNYGTIGGGVGNSASGTGSTIGGGNRNTASALGALGIFGAATIGGGQYNSASGDDSTIGGGYGNSASELDATIGGGSGNSASGVGATIGGGENNIASAEDATIGGGDHNSASGMGATIPGGSTASATHFGEMAYSSGAFANTGDAQTSLFVLRNTTTDATETELFLDGYNYRITIPATRTLSFEILVAARSSTGESAGYRVRGVVKNVGGVTSVLYGASGESMGADDGTWYAVALADTINNALAVKVGGATGKTIRWVAVVRTAEVAY